MNRHQRLDRLLRTSVPCRKVIAGQLPTAIRSGCIVTYHGSKYFLTAAHGINTDHQWAIEICADFPNLQTKLYGPLNFHFVENANVNMGKKFRPDFAWTLIPDHVVPVYQEYTPYGGLTRELSRLILPLYPNIVPSRRSIYGFSGQTNLGLLANGHWHLNVRREPDLTYVRTEGDVHVFQLPHAHPGHPHYLGCSGSPIVDGKERVVALVIRGDVGANQIYGISIQAYANVLHP